MASGCYPGALQSIHKMLLMAQWRIPIYDYFAHAARTETTTDVLGQWGVESRAQRAYCE